VNVEWITLETILIIHELQIDEHGGAPGIRDSGALESALARPKSLAAYATPDLCDLAAAYAWGISRNHPFIDGNKRTAFVVAAAFLDLNGRPLVAEEAESVATFQRLAEGMPQGELAEWIRQNSEV
jgi:death-on-curing protein